MPVRENYTASARRGFFNSIKLTTAARYFYRKKDKLKSRKVIEQLFSKGNSFSNFPFKILWLRENKTTALQTGIGVSSKHFKKAVDRNRIKRIMREAYRLQKAKLQIHLQEKGQQLSVFILYVGKEMPEYKIVFEKFGTILSRLIKFTDENDQTTA